MCMCPPLQKKKIGVKNLDLWLKTVLQTKKSELITWTKHLYKPNQNTWNKVGFVVRSSASPQGDVGSNLIVAKVVTSNWGKVG